METLFKFTKKELQEAVRTQYLQMINDELIKEEKKIISQLKKLKESPWDRETNLEPWDELHGMDGGTGWATEPGEPELDDLRMSYLDDTDQESTRTGGIPASLKPHVVGAEAPMADPMYDRDRLPPRLGWRGKRR